MFLKHKNQKQGIRTKKGATSMIVTVFTIILFSIITLAFTRLILSEVNQTTNTNLSKSAYDSALAGVEDAKIALLKYHDCLNKGHTVGSGTTCSKIIAAMQDGVRRQDCSTVSNVLGRTVDEQHGVTIQIPVRMAALLPQNYKPILVSQSRRI